MLGLKPGMTVVDVGCGIGTATIESVGRQFHRMLRRAGFDDVKVHADTVTSTAPAEYGFVVEIIGSRPANSSWR